MEAQIVKQTFYLFHIDNQRKPKVEKESQEKQIIRELKLNLRELNPI